MQIPAIDKVRVSMHGETVGTIASTPDGLMAFEYADSWLADGFSISPFSLPLEKRVFVSNWRPFDGVFGIFDDSLPDGWGRLLVDRALAKHGLNPREVGFLARLSFVGSSGMGALEYEPETSNSISMGGVDFDAVAEECARLLSTNDSENLDELLALGGSSGGARPKVLTQVDGEEWIVKFPSSVDAADIGAREYRVMQLAKQCGLNTPETRLFSSKRCSGYFGVKRFDRIGGSLARKVHMASAGALLESSHRIPNLEYELLMRLTTLLTESAHDVEQLYRLMCFNVFVGNRDDHAKNFSFLYDETARAWSLSPAYDLTQNAGTYGERATTVHGKGKGIEVDDMVAVGEKAGIKHALALSIAKEMRKEIEAEGLLDCQ